MSTQQPAAPFIGSDSLVSDTALDAIRNHDSVLGYPGLADILSNIVGAMPITLAVPDVSSGTERESIEWLAPFPCVVLYVQAGCISSAGSAAVAQAQVARAADLATWADLSDSDIDIDTGAGRYAESTVKESEATLAAGDALRAQIGSTGGVCAGGSVIVWVRRS